MARMCRICKGKYHSSGLCSKCWFEDDKERKKNNLPLRGEERKKNGIGNAKGCLRKDGYRALFRKGHPNAYKDGRILEHTFVMSEHLKRPLMKNETVHHINGVRDDNRIENLQLWSTSQPSGQRVDEKITWAKEFLESYGYKIVE